MAKKVKKLKAKIKELEEWIDDLDIHYKGVDEQYEAEIKEYEAEIARLKEPRRELYSFLIAFTIMALIFIIAAIIDRKFIH